MLVFLDETNKIYYIMAPKCGNTTIAKMLNVNLHSQHDLSNINNPEYKKIIIIRKDLIDRFLSGFYEDLFNNSCYSNVNVSFNNYLLFLYKCFKQKHPYVDNMKIYNEQDIPIWYGNCSNFSLPITNNKGDFVSHIQTQYYAINDIISLIKNKTNVTVVEITKLSNYLNNNIRENVKDKIIISDDINFSELPLSYIKNNRIIINKDVLNDKQKELILEIYKEDVIFINNLENKFFVF
jgi:hypothetical protein